MKAKKIKYGFLIIFISTFILLSCTNEGMIKPANSDLKGKWVEVNTKTDTLVFGVIESIQWFDLKRGKETNNEGLLVPKIHSGLYDYQFAKDNAISLYYTFSSNNARHEYYFEFSGDELKIGNFYNSPSGTILTFKRLN